MVIISLEMFSNNLQREDNDSKINEVKVNEKIATLLFCVAWLYSMQK